MVKGTFSLASCMAKLAFNGKTSLLTPWKNAIALVHDKRPATSPQTRLAVSIL